ncbi:hypothetical protein IV500_17825 [Paeniglutamicibacter antarcticus]|uniref:Uncharacterized protein n=1 Tax=Arthrobacter terrae TaxID=2935737 RepID=A0A931CTP5_9MICC|nr:hypothetical protein [Arthrobacter terrae]MBG0741229.1 hypothetical protein [Arthrobacter terrae]
MLDALLVALLEGVLEAMVEAVVEAVVGGGLVVVAGSTSRLVRSRLFARYRSWTGSSPAAVVRAGHRRWFPRQEMSHPG